MKKILCGCCFFVILLTGCSNMNNLNPSNSEEENAIGVSEKSNVKKEIQEPKATEKILKSTDIELKEEYYSIEGYNESEISYPRNYYVFSLKDMTKTKLYIPFATELWAVKEPWIVYRSIDKIYLANSEESNVEVLFNDNANISLYEFDGEFVYYSRYDQSVNEYFFEKKNISTKETTVFDVDYKALLKEKSEEYGLYDSDRIYIEDFHINNSGLYILGEIAAHINWDGEITKLSQEGAYPTLRITDDEVYIKQRISDESAERILRLDKENQIKESIRVNSSGETRYIPSKELIYFIPFTNEQRVFTYDLINKNEEELNITPKEFDSYFIFNDNLFYKEDNIIYIYEETNKSKVLANFKEYYGVYILGNDHPLKQHFTRSTYKKDKNLGERYFYVITYDEGFECSDLYLVDSITGDKLLIEKEFSMEVKRDREQVYRDNWNNECIRINDKIYYYVGVEKIKN